MLYNIEVVSRSLPFKNVPIQFCSKVATCGRYINTTNLKLMIKKIIALTSIFSLLAIAGYGSVEPTLVIAQATDTDTVEVNMVVTEEIAITSPADVTMTALSTSVNNSTGVATWNVKTNSTAGYELEVQADTDPAMQSGADQFADYSDTPAAWSVSASSYEFGFSAYGDDVVAAFGAGTTCGTGATVGDGNYRGFTGVTDIQIATDTDPTAVAGTNTNVCFAAGQNGVFAPSGSYNATITATATSL